MRPSLALAVLSLTTGSASAQSVELLLVSKGHVFQQRDAATVTPAVDTYPFLFTANVDGTDIDLLTPAPVVSGPISNPNPGHNNGVLGYDEYDRRWRYGFPNFDDWGVDTQGELDSLFANGTYQFTIGRDSAGVVLTGDAYPASASVALTGGLWEHDSVYVVEPGDSVGLTSSSFAEWGTHVESVVFAGLLGPDGPVAETESWASLGGDPFVTLSIPGASLVAGTDYRAEVNFIAAVDVLDADPANPGATLMAATYESLTLCIVRVRAPTDLNADGQTDAADLAELLAKWGKCPSECRADIDGDGIVGAQDLAALLGSWGS